MGNLLNAFDRSDLAPAAYGLALHGLALVLLAGLMAAGCPHLLARGRRAGLVFSVLPLAVPLGGLLQLAAGDAWHRPSFFAAPLFAEAVAVAAWLFWSRPAAGADHADYADAGPSHRDSTPPPVRRPPA